MNVALRRPMTLNEFLVWEREQELRYEFDGVQPIAMARNGGTLNHSIIALNVCMALDRRLLEPCRAFQTSVKVVVQNRVRYPDVSVTCSPFDGHSDIVPEPVLLVEVLSASTRVIDEGIKASEYLATSSVAHYLMLEQSRAVAVLLSRSAEEWTEATITGLDGVVRLDALGLTLPMAEIYRRVEL